VYRGVNKLIAALGLAILELAKI